MVEISVLFYVYNAENFLEGSLDSLINQSFHDFEVLCIDDGSTDNSLSILKDYSKKDRRIRYFSTDHDGFSKSINNILTLTGGKYVYFMNADSLLKFYALGFMYENAEEHDADILLTKVNFEYDSIYYNKTAPMEDIENNFDDVFNFKDLENLIFEADVSLENKFFKTSLLKEHNIRFFEDLDFPEHLFFYDSLLSAEKVFMLKDFLFIHRKPLKSFSNDNLKLMDMYREYNLILNLFKEHDLFEDYENCFLDCKINLIMRNYKKLSENIKENFFIYFRSDLINDFTKGRIDNDSIENLPDFNRKIFEQILISESSYEFDLLRKNYFRAAEYNRLLDRKSFLNSVSHKSFSE